MANVHSALLQVQQQEMGIVVQTTKEIKQLSWQVIAKQKLNYDADRCPCCKKGTMVTLLHFDAHAPPDMESLKVFLEMIKGNTAG